MNSEELEQSLRTEFESYLKDILAEMKQEVAEFQTKFQSEFEKHKSQLDTVFQDFSSRIENDRELDAPFRESIVEHLRLARDEGASITATAIAEAEEMQREADAKIVAPPVVADYSGLKDAIQDISEKDSQSAILKALVNHAGQFTTRGAFFIIKNEHFVGWRVFGEEGETDEQAVREIFFPVNADTILGESVRSLSAVESSDGTYAEDSLFLNKLEFGQPEKMLAIPLVARNRGVAVLYADHGGENGQINISALEMLVRVAGLTVELLAASQAAKPRKEDLPATFHEETFVRAEEKEFEAAAAPYQIPTSNGFEKISAGDDFDAPAVRQDFVESESAKEFSNDYQYQPAEQFHPTESKESNFEIQNDYRTSDARKIETVEHADEVQEAVTAAPQIEETAAEYSWNQPSDNDSAKFAETVETPNFSATGGETNEIRDFSFEPTIGAGEKDENAAIDKTGDFEFAGHQPYEFPAETAAAKVETADFQLAETEIPQFESTYKPWNSGAVETPEFGTAATAETGGDFQPKTFETAQTAYENFTAAPVETPIEKTAPPVKSRLSERNVDLPIEVAEDERRSHNDARRFARLLVSEIKLYNEQKVKEGREMSDLYDRLREAIDRSREMYDKRVQSPVAAKFDYFHYELVNNLAEGSESKLGRSYPGAAT